MSFLSFSISCFLYIYFHTMPFWISFCPSQYLMSVQFRSVTHSCPTLATPWTAACQASLSITNSWSLLKLMSITSVMPSNHLILCCQLVLPPSIFPSIRVFSKESVLHIRWPKYWSFSFSISPSDEYSGLISFRIDWLDLLAVLGTLKSLFQHHSSKASILRHSAFFIVQLLHPYMTTGCNGKPLQYSCRENTMNWTNAYSYCVLCPVHYPISGNHLTFPCSIYMSK